MIYLLLDGTEIDINQLLLDYSKLKLHTTAFYNKQYIIITNLIILFMFMWKICAVLIWYTLVLDMMSDSLKIYLPIKYN